jgi:hypothetical protein
MARFESYSRRKKFGFPPTAGLLSHILRILRFLRLIPMPSPPYAAQNKLN